MNRDEEDIRQNQEDELLEGLASLPYLERLTSFIRGSTRHCVTGGVTVVDFRPLYSVTIHHLQRQLAEEIQKIGDAELTTQQLEEIRETLHKYTHALRDFEFIHANRWNTYFVKDIAASRMDNGQGSRLQAALISELNLKAEGPHSSLFRDSDLLGSFNPKLMQHSMSMSHSLGTDRAHTVADQERRVRLRLTLKRFAFAVIGGLIIVMPMLILVSETATLKKKAVISASIFLFALGVAVFSNTTPEYLLVATAAYAAVLVTFIGN
ncbi:hypothetical protein EDB80DRAFT_882552 [Ilyonectria destructans]|nr:hypothetical protein EDB80DRAFT_882552 [Ilyonectria destructans]